jgi:hypothetical protein
MSTTTQQVKRSEALTLQAWVVGVRHWLALASVLVAVGAFNLYYLMRTPAAFGRGMECEPRLGSAANREGFWYARLWCVRAVRRLLDAFSPGSELQYIQSS